MVADLGATGWEAFEGLSQGTYSSWETGASVPAAEKLIALAYYFDVTLDWLVMGKGAMRADPSTAERQVEAIRLVLDPSEESHRELADLLLQLFPHPPDADGGEDGGVQHGTASAR